MKISTLKTRTVTVVGRTWGSAALNAHRRLYYSCRQFKPWPYWTIQTLRAQGQHTCSQTLGAHSSKYWETGESQDVRRREARKRAGAGDRDGVDGIPSPALDLVPARASLSPRHCQHHAVRIRILDPPPLSERRGEAQPRGQRGTRTQEGRGRTARGRC